jgi:hypothetical protein
MTMDVGRRTLPDLMTRLRYKNPRPSDIKTTKSLWHAHAGDGQSISRAPRCDLQPAHAESSPFDQRPPRPARASVHGDGNSDRSVREILVIAIRPPKQTATSQSATRGRDW